jgi:hypothetical protein
MTLAHLKNSWGNNMCNEELWNEDLIVAELRQIREEHAAQFNYDIRAIVHSLQQEEAQSGCQLVSFARQPKEGQLSFWPKPPLDNYQNYEVNYATINS